MKPFFTIILDSYRSLKSETIFWITLGLSTLVALLFLSVGIDEEGLSIFFGAFHWNAGEALGEESLAGVINRILYLTLFSNLVAGVWLTFIATILALISCASIFPDTLSEGTAGMLMTKKPSRLMIFFAKLTGSLLFVFVQVGLFVVIVFFAFRWRLGVWNFSVFWYVPAVLLVFLNLYSVMVLVGIKTRSILAPILVTMLIWGVSAVLNVGIKSMGDRYEMSKAPGNESVVSQVEDTPADREDEVGAEKFETELTEVSKVERGQDTKDWLRILETVHLFFPKNGPIMEVAEEKLVVSGLEEFGGFDEIKRKMEESGKGNDLDESMDEAPAWDSRFSAIGSSVAFCFVMLGLAGWSFCRKEI